MSTGGADHPLPEAAHRHPSQAPFGGRVGVRPGRAQRPHLFIQKEITMSAKLNTLVLLSIAALIGGCGGGGYADDGAASSAQTTTESVGQTSPAAVPANGKDTVEQRTY